jgi:GT2 family glycosyltransferase
MEPTDQSIFETISIASPLVCVYVITYNGKRFLETCFLSLSQLTDYRNHQLILVDNGSSDGSGDYVREKFQQVEVLRVFPNAGYAHGANAAIADARRRGAKYIALMNDDIEILHSDWLRAAITQAERDPNIGIIGFNEATSDGGSRDVTERSVTDVVYLGSFALVIPMELFERIGLFDELYYVVGDEDDLGARSQAAGYRTVILRIPIYHFGGGTNQTYKLKTAYLQMRNGIRFCLKQRNPVRALLRAVRIIDLACNPWPFTFDSHDAGHRRVRNSGNVFINFLLWVRAVSWNMVHLPQTFRIRAVERRYNRAARDSQKRSAQPSRPLVNGELSCKPAYMGDQS